MVVNAPGDAAPRRPVDDSLVLVRLPGGAAAGELAALRRAADEAPGEIGRSRALARSYLDLGRRQEEPRLVAYAYTVIEPAIRADDASADDLVLAATARQYLHEFDGAITLLERALAREPRHAQALLVLADLQEVRGEFAAARRTCARLAANVAPLVALACLTSVDSRTGKLDESYRRLTSTHAASPGLPADIDAWILGMLADMAGRSGDGQARGRYLAAARERVPDDPKVRALHADGLLERGELAPLLRIDTPTAAIGDAMLLRLAIGARRAGDPRAREWAEAFRERARLAGGDGRHLREGARFALEVDDDPRAALRLARENWAKQREPEDLRLLFRAAKAAGDDDAWEEARRWIAAHGYEDRTLV